MVLAASSLFAALETHPGWNVAATWFLTWTNTVDPTDGNFGKSVSRLREVDGHQAIVEALGVWLHVERNQWRIRSGTECDCCVGQALMRLAPNVRGTCGGKHFKALGPTKRDIGNAVRLAIGGLLLRACHVIMAAKAESPGMRDALHRPFSK